MIYEVGDDVHGDGDGDGDDMHGYGSEDVHRGPGQVARVVVRRCLLDLLLCLVSASRLLQEKNTQY